MSDSSLRDVKRNLLWASEKVPNPSSPGERVSPSHNQATYFRHKGIKVKFEDIEKLLQSCDWVKQSVVLSGEDIEGNRRLVAYIIPNGEFNQVAFAKYMADKMPPHMIPAIWVCLEKFPLTASGEIDRDALYEPGSREAESRHMIAPRNETEVKLAHIIQGLLGVQSISIRDNFFRLGGGSLQALRVISAIRKEFNLALDIKYFFIYPTIAELAAYLQKLLDKDPSASSAGSPEETFDNQGHKWHFNPKKSIVPIKTGSSKMPLYIVCGGGGSVFTFEKFAHLLDEDQPVYGFQQPSDINELEKFPVTIEEIAGKYVDELLLIDPEGPYALSGHCIGGVIALEMARKLDNMGKKIQLLAMFDVIIPKKEAPQPATLKNLFHIPRIIKKVTEKFFLKIEFETFLLTRHTRDALDYKFNSFKSLVNRFYKYQEEDVELFIFKQFEQKFETAFKNYQVKKIDQDILVFYAKDHYYFLDRDRNIRFKKFQLEEEIKNKWIDYARGTKVYETEGGHSTMFEPFYSGDIARVLKQHLK